MKKAKPVGQEVVDELKQVNPDALLADGFEAALIGYIERCGQPTLAMYDRVKCIKVLMMRDKMTDMEAEEYFEYNVLGSYVGENTPAFVTILKR